jgi:tetratricopeptide (TPR) repeat protein
MLLKTLALAFSAATALLASAPAAAEPLPKPEAVALPDERPLLPELLAALSPGGDIAAAAARYDAVLAKLPRQTPLRGFVQFFRAQALMRPESGRQPEALAAIEESIRLLPQHGAPLFVAAGFYAYGDEPGKAVDYLLRAARVDPPILHRLNDYEANNLLLRLGESNDRLRRVTLSERLLDIGWRGGRSGTTSAMAFEVLQARIDSGNVTGASAMLPRIVTPALLVRLLTEKKYEPLRAAAEDWAGPRLEKQWPIYLRQARSEWEASNDLEAGRTYAAALDAAGHDETLIGTFAPLFNKPIDPKRQPPLIFIASPVAGALARRGRWDEALAIYDSALKAWPAGEAALALNLSANRARTLVMRGDFAGGLAALDGVVADAAKWGGEVNHGALAAMHLYRACALAALGRSAEDVTSSATVAARRSVDPSAYIRLLICKNDLPAARKVMSDALADDELRNEVLPMFRPPAEKPYDSDYARTIAARFEKLRQDPSLRAAAAKHSRLLTEPLNAAAPPEELETSAS